MIKLIYSTIVADPKELQAALIGMDIAIFGVSTFESVNVPETWVLVPDETTNTEKIQIDAQVEAATKKSAPTPEDVPVNDEEIIDETREI